METLTEALARMSGPRAEFRVRPVPPAALPVVPGLLAGAAEVDLTPPPGLPRAGYSRNAHTGNGFRTRLRARVVHLRSGTASLAIIATDLLGGSSVVQHLVALDVARDTDVPLAGVFLGATHTHGAPGQFHGTDFYNRYSSDGVGFDPAWTAFLADRIAGAVREAVASRRPARMAWGRVEVPGVTRNRALPAYRRNPGLVGAADAGAAVNPWLDLLRVDCVGAAGVGADGVGADVVGAEGVGGDGVGERRIDRGSEVVGGGSEPLAALAVFSVHGTAVPMASTTYNADLWAYLVQELSDRVAAGYGRRPVVGALQGTHGDVTPALRGPAGHPEARRIGREIGAAAAALYGRLDGALAGSAGGDGPVGGLGSPEAPAGGSGAQGGPAGGSAARSGTADGSGAGGVGAGGVALAAGFRELDLAAGTTAGGLRLPNRPAVGAALIAGAKENETPGIRLVPPFRAGYGKRLGGRGPQGAKWVLGSRWLQPLVLPLAEFPRVLPVHVVRVGEVLLTGIPMEVTTESGRRIAHAVEIGWRTGSTDARAAGGGVAAGGDVAAGGEAGPVRAVVSSVADEYAGYCTTADEYGAQFYEGGHTIYGPQTQRYFTAAARELAADLARAAAAGGVVQQPLPERDFRLKVHRYLATGRSARGGPARGRSARGGPATGELISGDLGTGVAESGGPPFRGHTGLEPYLEWQWLDDGPGDLTWYEPMLSVVDAAGDRIVGDHTGELEILHLGPDGGAEGDSGGGAEGIDTRHRYAVRWYSPTSVRESRDLRFAVHHAGLASPLLSPPLR